MTNREWLATLTDEEFAEWATHGESINLDCLVDEELYICKQPTPKLETIKYSDTSSYYGLLKWLKEERILKS